MLLRDRPHSVGDGPPVSYDATLLSAEFFFVAECEDVRFTMPSIGFQETSRDHRLSRKSHECMFKDRKIWRSRLSD